MFAVKSTGTSKLRGATEGGRSAPGPMVITGTVEWRNTRSATDPQESPGQSAAAVGAEGDEVDLLLAGTLQDGVGNIAFGHQQVVVLTLLVGAGFQLLLEFQQVAPGGILRCHQGFGTGHGEVIQGKDVDDVALRRIVAGELESKIEGEARAAGEIFRDQNVADAHAGRCELSGSHGVQPISPRGGVTGGVETGVHQGRKG